MLTATLAGSFLSYLKTIFPIVPENNLLTACLSCKCEVFWREALHTHCVYYTAMDGYGDGRGGRSLPHPGGDGLVVEDDRSTTSDEHWLTILVDHVVVHSDEDEDYDNEENSKEKPVKDGKFAKASDCHSSHTCWNL